MVMTPDLSLYTICLNRINDLMKAGTWKSCLINPFSNLPSKIIDDVMTRIISKNGKISQIFLLLTSGSLTRLVLSEFLLQEERDLFQEVIRRNCFKSLRYLDWHNYWYDGWQKEEKKSIPLIEDLVRLCPKLEEFSSNYFLNLDAFENCKELRILKFYVSLPNLSPMDLTVLSSLKNLQVFFSIDMNDNAITSVLRYCPQLISVERNDSLNALQQIHMEAMNLYGIDYTKVPDHFQLKRCLWGMPISEYVKKTTITAASYKFSFPEKIRIAVSLCPLVEVLTINIYNSRSIESLKNLKHLTSLKICFNDCEGDYMPTFLGVLKIIGQKLNHLTFERGPPVPVDIIFDFCPQLESFIAQVPITVSRLDHPFCNVSLKKLVIWRTNLHDRNALFYLLSNCKALEDLTILKALCLDDDLLRQILSVNPMTELKNSHIIDSDITSRGFRMFFETAVSLERVNFPPFDGIVKKLIQELNLTDISYGHNCTIPKAEGGAYNVQVKGLYML